MIRTLATALSAGVVLLSGIALAQSGPSRAPVVTSTPSATQTDVAKQKQQTNAQRRMPNANAARLCADSAAIASGQNQARAKAGTAMMQAHTEIGSGIVGAVASSSGGGTPAQAGPQAQPAAPQIGGAAALPACPAP